MAKLEVGQAAPEFELIGLDGERFRLADRRGEVVVVVFWSAECAWCRHYDTWLGQQAPSWAEQGIWLTAVASNANESPTFLAQTVSERGIAFPVLLDPGAAVADSYTAEVTPHVFVVDRDGRLAYRGAIDDRTFRKRRAEVNYLEQALAALRQGGHPAPAETEAYGCVLVRTAEAPGPVSLE